MCTPLEHCNNIQYNIVTCIFSNHCCICRQEQKHLSDTQCIYSSEIHAKQFKRVWPSNAWEKVVKSKVAANHNDVNPNHFKWCTWPFKNLAATFDFTTATLIIQLDCILHGVYACNAELAYPYNLIITAPVQASSSSQSQDHDNRQQNTVERDQENASENSTDKKSE